MREKFSVTGMSCSACSAGIERTLNKTDGVIKVEVSLMGECMTVEYDENVVGVLDNIKKSAKRILPDVTLLNI